MLLPVLAAPPWARRLTAPSHHPPPCRIELPRTLQVVANLLRQRLQRIRDDARAVLVQMAAELGPYYLPYVCRVLQAALPDKGFTAHVVRAPLPGAGPALAWATLRCTS